MNQRLIFLAIIKIKSTSFFVGLDLSCDLYTSNIAMINAGLNITKNNLSGNVCVGLNTKTINYYIGCSLTKNYLKNKTNDKSSNLTQSVFVELKYKSSHINTSIIFKFINQFSISLKISKECIETFHIGAIIGYQNSLNEDQKNSNTESENKKSNTTTPNSKPDLTNSFLHNEPNRAQSILESNNASNIDHKTTTNDHQQSSSYPHMPHLDFSKIKKTQETSHPTNVPQAKTQSKTTQKTSHPTKITPNNTQNTDTQEKTTSRRAQTPNTRIKIRSQTPSRAKTSRATYQITDTPSTHQQNPLRRPTKKPNKTGSISYTTHNPQALSLSESQANKTQSEVKPLTSVSSAQANKKEPIINSPKSVASSDQLNQNILKSRYDQIINSPKSISSSTQKKTNNNKNDQNIDYDAVTRVLQYEQKKEKQINSPDLEKIKFSEYTQKLPQFKQYFAAFEFNNAFFQNKNDLLNQIVTALNERGDVNLNKEEIKAFIETIKDGLYRESMHKLFIKNFIDSDSLKKLCTKKSFHDACLALLKLKEQTSTSESEYKKRLINNFIYHIFSLIKLEKTQQALKEVMQFISDLEKVKKLYKKYNNE